jgi:hypothetical protein
MDGPLEALAGRLVIPARSGVYLTKNELVQLARAAEGSLRVNERKRMLVDVLKSPQSPSEFRSLLARLTAFCQAQLDEHQALAREYPLMEPHCAPWIQHARAMIEALADVAEDVSFAERAQPPPGEPR